MTQHISRDEVFARMKERQMKDLYALIRQIHGICHNFIAANKEYGDEYAELYGIASANQDGLDRYDKDSYKLTIDGFLEGIVESMLRTGNSFIAMHVLEVFSSLAIKGCDFDIAWLFTRKVEVPKTNENMHLLRELFEEMHRMAVEGRRILEARKLPPEEDPRPRIGKR